jgi:hypothetical protein
VSSDRLLPGVLIASLLFSSAAYPASIANRDGRDHTVTVIEGNSQKDHILKPNAVLEGVCEAGCLIRLDDSREDPFELDGSEITSIEEGQLYDDELGVPAGPDQGSAAQPSQPSPRP